MATRNLRIEHKLPSIQEFQRLRESANWPPLQDETIQRGLLQSLFSICAYDGQRIVGMGRIIGDGSMYFYIQDVIVLPSYQHKGIGRKIMEELEIYLMEHAEPGSFIGLMAAEDVSGFYKQWGYHVRPASKPGMYKMIH